jgi:3-deoxy-D-manno-octulosonic-acid transferase
MFGHDIIAIGASVGGVEALPRLIGSLPTDLPASIFVVLHSAPQGRDFCPKLSAKPQQCRFVTLWTVKRFFEGGFTSLNPIIT